MGRRVDGVDDRGHGRADVEARGEARRVRGASGRVGGDTVRECERSGPHEHRGRHGIGAFAPASAQLRFERIQLLKNAKSKRVLFSD